jgi:LPPG:FO 2-phospho-L-lactate transferase
MLVVLSGGTGTPKLLQGLKEVVDPRKIGVIVNTAEDCWLSHGYFSPDVDTVLYTMADLINEETWYGIKNDTFETHVRLNWLGYDEILKIGDLDRATQIQKGTLLGEGKSLSEAVDIQRKALGIKAKIFPMTNDKVETVVVTPEKEMKFHEFWIEKKGRPEVIDIFFNGIEKAKGCVEAVKAIRKSEGVIIGPSNPVSSILPIILLRGIREEIQKKRDNCIAVSPIVGHKPISGPADKFMKAKGLGVDSFSVAKFYKELVGSFIIDILEEDVTIAKIEKLGIECFKTDTIMKDIKDKKALASFVLNLLIFE